MLRFELNRRDISSDIENINFTTYNIEVDEDDPTMSLVTFFYNGDVPVLMGEYVTATVEVNRDQSMSGRYMVCAVNDEDQSFSIRIPNESPVEIDDVYLAEENDGGYIYFEFNGNHNYDPTDTIIVTARFYVDGVLTSVGLSCEYVSETEVRWRMTAEGENMIPFLRHVYHNDHYELIEEPEGVTVTDMDSVPMIVGYGDPMYIRVNGSPFYRYTQIPTEPTDAVWTDENTVYEIPDSAGLNSEKYLRLRTEYGYLFYAKEQCEGPWIYYQRICEDGDMSLVDFFIENVILDRTITLSHQKNKTRLIIPIQQMFDTRTRSEELIYDNFVRDEKKNAINGIAEMEKYCYAPAFPKFLDNKVSGYQLISKIKFNLHFRQHRGDDWIAENDTFWNGVDNNTIQLLDNVYGAGMPTTSDPDRAFFSYQGNLQEKQSDLLTYLGFKDSDIKYQKSKLKKSFLRLSFYDSDIPSRQRLLGYATVYMDSGLLFQKYMGNMTKYPYTSNEGSVIGFRRGYEGARVNREPDIAFDSTTRQCSGDLWDIISTSNLRGDALNDEIEKLRLSSQICIEDKRTSQASSEGFYIYLWADNDQGLMPSDLYMKVDFNHAGYGRNIPFMMPYYEMLRDNRLGIKTFDEILRDWRTGNEYDIRTYQKYSYIKLKYVYDIESKKHVYYLNEDVYGPSSVAYANDDTELEFNLYEAKISMYSLNDRNPATTPYGVPARRQNTNNCQ